MLVIKNLTLYLKKDMRTLVEDFTFSITQNQKVALIGEEGNGKSSLLKAIYDLDLVDEYLEVSGFIFKQNEIIGYLPQSLPADLSDISTHDFIYTGFNEFDYGSYYRYLSDLNIDEKLIGNDVLLKNLSGGEKIKIQLLSILMKNPTLLLLDEPTNDLDIEAIIWLENFINNISIPIMFISHDERLLEKCAGTIILFEQLKRKTVPKHTIENLDYKNFVAKRWASIENQERLANKEQEIFDKKMKRYREIYDKVERAQSNVSRQDPAAGKNLKDKMHSVKSMGRRFEKEKDNLTERPDYEESIYIRFSDNIYLPNGKTVLEYGGKSLVIGDKVLSDNPELTIYGAEKICIVGSNGSGKTTLLKDLIPKIISRLRVFYMPQNYLEVIDMNKTPIEYLAQDTTKEEITKVRTYLGSLKFTVEEMNRPIAELSGGQVAKLYFSQLTSGEYEVLVLDEPTRNLSPLSGPEIRKTLAEFKGAIISVSHDRKYLEEVCDKIYLLNSEGLMEVNKLDFLKRYN